MTNVTLHAIFPGNEVNYDGVCRVILTKCLQRLILLFVLYNGKYLTWALLIVLKCNLLVTLYKQKYQFLNIC